MNKADSYVGEIKRLDEEIKRINMRLSALREQRKEKRTLLYKHMEKNGMTKHGGITINSIRPREQTRRKPESEKKQDAIILFQEVGIENPEEFYNDFKATQKYNNGEDPPPKEKKKSKKKSELEYDPFLGY